METEKFSRADNVLDLVQKGGVPRGAKLEISGKSIVVGVLDGGGVVKGGACRMIRRNSNLLCLRWEMFLSGLYSY